MGQKLTDTQVKGWALSGTVKKGGVIIPARTLSDCEVAISGRFSV